MPQVYLFFFQLKKEILEHNFFSCIKVKETGVRIAEWFSWSNSNDLKNELKYKILRTSWQEQAFPCASERRTCRLVFCTLATSCKFMVNLVFSMSHYMSYFNFFRTSFDLSF